MFCHGLLLKLLLVVLACLFDLGFGLLPTIMERLFLYPLVPQKLHIIDCDFVLNPLHYIK